MNGTTRRRSAHLDQRGSALRTSLNGFAPSFTSFRASGYRVVTTQAQPTAVAHQKLRVRLKKAYIRGLHTSKSATVILAVETLDRDGTATGQEILRGTDTGVNWANGEDEINSAFNGALEGALIKAEAFFARQCRGA